MSNDPGPNWGNWSIGRIAIAILVIAGIIGVVYVVLDQIGISIPGWIVHLLWIAFAVFIGVLFIRFLMSLKW